MLSQTSVLPNSSGTGLIKKEIRADSDLLLNISLVDSDLLLNISWVDAWSVNHECEG